MKGLLFRLLGGVFAMAALMGAAHGANPMLSKVELKPASRAERDAGVWVDGQYFGFVKELKGKKRLVLMPGRHELRLKLAGYEEYVAPIDLEPGESRRYLVSLQPLAGATYPDADQTATVRFDIEPARAALFVDGVYAGHVDKFSGRRGLRLRAGTHRFRIALPGYQSFETEMTLSASQRYELKVALPRGSMSDQPEDVVARDAGR